MTKLIILIGAFTGGMMAVSYFSLAQQKGWPIGKTFRNPRSFPNVAGASCVLGSLILTLIVNPWWSVFMVVIFGFLLNMLLTAVLKTFTQVVSVAMIIASLVCIAIFVI